MAQIKFGKIAQQGLELPPAGKRLTVYDTKVPKLALRITSAGAKTFYMVKRAGADDRMVIRAFQQGKIIPG